MHYFTHRNNMFLSIKKWHKQKNYLCRFLLINYQCFNKNLNMIFITREGHFWIPNKTRFFSPLITKPNN